MKGGAKSRVVTISLSPQDRLVPGLLKEKVTIPVDGGAVNTNDWCIRRPISFHKLISLLSVNSFFPADSGRQ